MQIAELEEYIFPTDYTAKKNSLQNSNSFYPFKNNNDKINFMYIATIITKFLSSFDLLSRYIFMDLK